MRIKIANAHLSSEISQTCGKIPQNVIIISLKWL